MTGLIVFILVVLILQVVLFFVIRRKRKEERKNSVIERYNIKSSSDAFRLSQDREIPEKDRKEIEILYTGEN